jgi:F1F0 ATPase subunit 2
MSEMGETAGWLAAALGGALLALAYFAGLWWTVQRATRARHPAAILAASYAIRAALAVAVLLLIMGGDVVRLLMALGGFLAVRTVVLWRVRHPRPRGAARAKA